VIGGEKGNVTLRTVKNNVGSFSKLLDLVHDRVAWVEVDSSDSRHLALVVSFHVVAEQHGRRERAYLFGEYFFPAIAQVVIEKFANRRVHATAIANPFKFVNRMAALVCQTNPQPVVCDLFEIYIGAWFNDGIAPHANVVRADFD